MANEIEDRYSSKGLHGLSLHPGGIWTRLQRFIPKETMEQWKARPSVENVLKSTEQGAATSVLAAVGRGYEGKGRLHLEDCDMAGLTRMGRRDMQGMLLIRGRRRGCGRIHWGWLGWVVSNSYS